MIVLKKNRYKEPTVKNKNDRHHILFIRREWNRGWASQLRLYPYCIVDIPRDTLHRQIHGHLAYIPVPRGNSAQEALKHLRYLQEYGAIGPNDTIEKRLRVLIALFDCTEQPTADALRKQLEIVQEFKKPP